MQTKKQKQEKALEYWRRELRNNRLVHRESYIKGQIAILERKLTLRATDAEDSAPSQAVSNAETLSNSDGFAVPTRRS